MPLFKKKAKEEPKKTEVKKAEPKKTETKTKAAPKKTEKPAAKKTAPVKKTPTKTTTAKKPVKKEEPKNDALKGQFEYYKTATGNFNFRLKASNKETIAVSGGAGYTTLAACKAGIESTRKIVNSEIEDQTLRKVKTIPNPKYEIYMDKAEKFRYRLRARNGELICTSEDGYSSKDACKKGIESLARWARDAEIVKGK